MRLRPALKLFFATAATLTLITACVGGGGQLPGEDGLPVPPSGSGSGSASGSGAGSSSGAGGTGSSPGNPNVEPPQRRDAGGPAIFDSGVRDTGGPVACTGTGQTSDFNPPACQTCLEAQCCSQLKTCFTIQGSGTKLGCNQFNQCIDTCTTDPDPTTCNQECQTNAQTGVTSAFQAILSCAQSKCAVDCEL